MYKYGIILIFLSWKTNLFSQEINFEITKHGALFMENSDTILYYQADPTSLNGTYTRSNYIHPLKLPDGSTITEDFPEDHLHHRGVFWAWHQLYIDDKRIGDGWALNNFKWEVQSMKVDQVPSKAKSLETVVHWKSPLWIDEAGREKAFVQETTQIVVYPGNETYRIVDVAIQLLALEPDLKIGGSEDPKGYGGFSARIKLGEGMKFTGPEGVVQPRTNPVAAGAWLDISGPVADEQSIGGITIFCHPSNPGHPNPWILRPKNSMQNAVYPFPGAEAVPLSTEHPTVLRYRLFLHMGGIEALDIPGHYQTFARE